MHLPAAQPEFTDLTAEQAANYLKGMESQPSRGLVAQWVGSRTVLDVGCANGIDAGLYAPERYVGVDVSRPLIEVARSRHPHHTFLWLGSIPHYIPVTQCAVVLIKSVLEYLPSEQQAVDLFDWALDKTVEELIVVWHAPPIIDRPTEIRRVTGHFGLPCWQNHYALRPFIDVLDGRPMVEVVSVPHTIWRIDCAGP